MKKLMKVLAIFSLVGGLYAFSSPGTAGAVSCQSYVEVNCVN